MGSNGLGCTQHRALERPGPPQGGGCPRPSQSMGVPLLPRLLLFPHSSSSQPSSHPRADGTSGPGATSVLGLPSLRAIHTVTCPENSKTGTLHSAPPQHPRGPDPRAGRPVHDGRVASVHLQTLARERIPPPDGAVGTACESGFVFQLAEGDVTLMPCSEGAQEHEWAGRQQATGVLDTRRGPTTFFKTRATFRRFARGWSPGIRAGHTLSSSPLFPLLH